MNKTVKRYGIKEGKLFIEYDQNGTLNTVQLTEDQFRSALQLAVQIEGHENSVLSDSIQATANDFASKIRENTVEEKSEEEKNNSLLETNSVLVGYKRSIVDLLDKMVDTVKS